jgi:hypothetical protein
MAKLAVYQQRMQMLMDSLVVKSDKAAPRVLNCQIPEKLKNKFIMLQ